MTGDFLECMNTPPFPGSRFVHAIREHDTIKNKIKQKEAAPYTPTHEIRCHIDHTIRLAIRLSFDASHMKKRTVHT